MPRASNKKLRQSREAEASRRAVERIERYTLAGLSASESAAYIAALRNGVATPVVHPTRRRAA